MFSAVIFDRDGVLVDVDMDAAARLFPPELPLTVAEVGQRWNAWGQRQGFPRSLNEEATFMRAFWDAIGEELALPPAVRSALYAVDYTSVLVPFPDARPALENARQKGLKTAVLSNFALASLDASLAAVGLMDLIDLAAAASVIGVSKPEPAAYLTVTGRLGVTPDTCLFFDDSPQHVAGARALGMHAYLVDRRARDDLANHVVRDLTALPALLGGDV
jgi:putative hydrolase of the HAD superfamily